MKKQRYTYLNDGFEGVLYEAENKDDRLLIVIHGLKGLELPEKYGVIFRERVFSSCHDLLWCTRTAGSDAGNSFGDVSDCG